MKILSAYLSLTLSMVAGSIHAEPAPAPSTGIYWAADAAAIATGLPRCKQFATPTLEEQQRKLTAKYGDALKGARIYVIDNQDRVFVASRHNGQQNGDVRYAYFESLGACERYQDKLGVKPAKQASGAPVATQKNDEAAKIKETAPPQPDKAKPSDGSYTLIGSSGICIADKNTVTGWVEKAQTDERIKVRYTLRKLPSEAWSFSVFVNGIPVTVFDLQSDCETYAKVAGG